MPQHQGKNIALDKVGAGENYSIIRENSHKIFIKYTKKEVRHMLQVINISACCKFFKSFSGNI